MNFLPDPFDGCIIVAPSYLHTEIKMHYIKQHYQLFNVSILTFSQWLENYHHQPSINNAIRLWELKDALQEYQHQFPQFQDAMDYVPFLQELIQFVDLANLYEVDLNQEVDLDPHAQQYVGIARITQNIMVQPKPTLAALRTIAKQDLSNVYLLLAYQNYFQHLQSQRFSQNNIHIIQTQVPKQTKSFFYATNQRCEIEACAQTIVNQQLNLDDVAITLCIDSLLPLTKQIFKRYQIPFHSLIPQNISPLKMQLIAFFDYLIHPSNSTLFTCLNTPAFQNLDTQMLQTYCDRFQKAALTFLPHLQDLPSLQYLPHRSIQKEIDLEKKALEIQTQILPFFTKLTSLTVLDAIAYALNALSVTVADQAAYTALCKLINTLQPYLKNNKDLSFLSAIIKVHPLTQPPLKTNQVLITNLAQPLYRKTQFIIGANQQNFPNIPLQKGMFDESFVSAFHSFPSLKERFAFYQNENRHFLQQRKQLIASYHLCDFQGKSLAASLDIEQYMDQPAIPYPLVQIHEETLYDTSIQFSTARKLFISDNQWKASITSLQRYASCAYRYFLEDGCKIKLPYTLEINEALIGSLIHALLQQLTKNFQKNYTENHLDTWQHFLSTAITEITSIFPHRASELSLIKDRLFHSLDASWMRFIDIEAHSRFQPYAFEKSFTYPIPLQSCTLQLHGIIDRIDHFNDTLAIFDYKSSPQHNSEQKLLAGVQLQLLTYAWIAENLYQKKVVSSHYIECFNHSSPWRAFSFNRRSKELITLDMHNLQAAFLKDHQLQGYCFDDGVTFLDDDATHIANLKYRNEQLQYKQAPLPQVATLLQALYQKICDQILAGNFACEPLVDACTYCPYDAICRFQGAPKDAQSLLPPTFTLYPSKGDK